MDANVDIRLAESMKFPICNLGPCETRIRSRAAGTAGGPVWGPIWELGGEDSRGRAGSSAVAGSSGGVLRRTVGLGLKRRASMGSF